ncbi:DUF418 domain-containing protein [Bacteroidota bacterium]
MKTSYSPIDAKERIVSLDVLRGFAVLGILIMNIQSFSMIFAAYQNPLAYGDLSGINLLIWKLSHVFADQKFMTIFSILFGAGILLMTQKIEKQGLSSKGLHFRRMMWLIIIGLLHAYFLWHGDILVNYGTIALLVYFFRKKNSRTLTVVGIAFIIIPSMLYWMSGWSMQYWSTEQITELANQWLPGQEIIDKEIAAFQGSWWSGVSHRSSIVLMLETSLVFLFGWRILGQMLIGMALYKSGFLSAKLSYKKYLLTLIICFSIGFTLIITGMNKNFNSGWDGEYSRFNGIQYNYWGSILVSIGYISIIMIIVKTKILSGLKNILAPVGRMAFTNYLLQTIICTIIFYGFGFGYFGKLTRAEQIIIVLCIWTFEIILSRIWLRYFKYGPFEWLWRSLSYRKLFKLRREIS